jgi:hypothetical protein
MRWLKRLMDYTKQRSYGIAGPGALSMKWNLPLWNGWIVSTIAGYWSRLEIFHRLNSKWQIIAN